MRSRFRYGFKSDGASGYYGYKWKRLLAVELFVWNFFELKVNQIENIEAELVYIIRRETGKWPLYQNEIHFNNNFDDGKKTAEKLFELIENKI